MLAIVSVQYSQIHASPKRIVEPVDWITRTCERGSIATLSEDSSSSGAVRDMVGNVVASDCALSARFSGSLLPSPWSSLCVLSALMESVPI